MDTLLEDTGDYEVIALTDRGTIFKSPFGELIWLETAGADDVLLDDTVTVVPGWDWP